jgi:hypothetical protein
MTEKEATVAIINAPNAQEIPYILVGSFSISFYGIPRLTQDADFVISIGNSSLAELAQHLGKDFQLDSQMSFETVTMTRRTEIRVVDSPFKIELFHLSSDPHDQERFRRRRKELYLDREVYLPTPEDVVVTKLNWALLANRSKDRNDARAVIAVQADRLDWDYIHLWADRHGTRALLDEIRQSIPPI